MNHPRPLDLTEGTVADLLTLMQEPPYPRRGNTYLDIPAQPAAGAGFTHVVASTWWERIVSLYFTFAASATVTQRQVLINLLNADGVLFNSTPAILQAEGGETWSVSADLSGTPGQVAGSSLFGTGTVTGPAAGATIASAPVGAGTWIVKWNVSLSGTVAAVEQNNFKITIPGVNEETSDNPAAVGGPWQQNDVEVTIPSGGATIAVKATAAGTGTAVYDASFSAIPQGTITAYPQLPNIVLKSGWQIQIVVNNAQVADQISGLAMLVERYPSNWADGSLASDYEGVIRSILGQ